MGAGHTHDIAVGQNERPLWWALGLTTLFLIVEFAGGLWTQSLALISDAAHMFTDAAALAIALAAVRIAKRPADSQRTFGYYRFEILAAALNAILLFGVALYILFEAYQRIQNPSQVQTLPMLLIAIAGLVINFISMHLLSSGKDSNLNMKGAYLEVWSDMLGSLGVIIGAVLIGLTSWYWIDSVVAVAIGLWVLPRTWILFKDSIHVLLEGIPAGVDLARVQQAILDVEGVRSLHDLHIWTIASGKISLTVHVVCTQGAHQWPQVLQSVRTLLAEQFDLHHVTIQPEPVACEQDSHAHSFTAPHDHHAHSDHHHRSPS